MKPRRSPLGDADLGKGGVHGGDVVEAGGRSGALDEAGALQGDGVEQSQVDVAGELLLGGLGIVGHGHGVAQVLGAQRLGGRLVVAHAHGDGNLGQVAEIGGLVEAVVGRADHRHGQPELVAQMHHLVRRGRGEGGRALADDQRILEAGDQLVEHDFFFVGELGGHWFAPSRLGVSGRPCPWSAGRRSAWCDPRSCAPRLRAVRGVCPCRS
jgi:hypothetical protein